MHSWNLKDLKLSSDNFTSVWSLIGMVNLAICLRIAECKWLFCRLRVPYGEMCMFCKINLQINLFHFISVYVLHINRVQLNGYSLFF